MRVDPLHDGHDLRHTMIWLRVTPLRIRWYGQRWPYRLLTCCFSDNHCRVPGAHLKIIGTSYPAYCSNAPLNTSLSIRFCCLENSSSYHCCGFSKSTDGQTDNFHGDNHLCHHQSPIHAQSHVTVWTLYSVIAHSTCRDPSCGLQKHLTMTIMKLQIYLDNHDDEQQSHFIYLALLLSYEITAKPTWAQRHGSP